MLRVRLYSLRLFSTDASSKNVSKRVELGPKLRAALVEKFASLPLLEKKSNTKLKVDGKGVTVEGPEEAVESLVKKLLHPPSATSTVTPSSATALSAGSEKPDAKFNRSDILPLLSTLLGEPKKLKLDEYQFNSILPRGTAASQNKHFWMLRSAATNTLFIWSESEEDAEHMLSRIQEWTPILTDYEHQRNPTKVVDKVHPSYRWYEKSALNDFTDAVINIQLPQAKVWASQKENADLAAELLQKPYQPPISFKSTPASFKPEMSFGSRDPILFEAMKKATEALSDPDDHLVRTFLDSDKQQVTFKMAHVQSRQVANAFQQEISKHLAATLPNNSGANCTFHGPLTAQILDKGLAEMRNNPSDWGDVQAFPFESIGSTIKVCLTGPYMAKINAAKWLFPAEGTVQLRRLSDTCGDQAKKLLHGTRFNDQFIRVMEINCLHWKQSKKLVHWGYDYFTCNAKTDEEIAQAHKDWESLRVQAVKGLELKSVTDELAMKPVAIGAEAITENAPFVDTPSTASNQLGEKYGISFWHIKPKETVVFGTQENISRFLDAVQPAAEKPSQSIPAKKPLQKLGPSLSDVVATATAEVPAKVTRLTVSKPPAAPIAPVVSSSTSAIKVTRITAPSDVPSPSKEKRERLGPSFNASPSSTSTTTAAAPADQASKMMSHFIEVPSKHGGKVVGRQGLVLKGIEERSKTRIRLVDDETGKSNMRKVRITGSSQTAIDKAAEEIQSIIESAIAEDEAGVGAPRGGRSGGASTRRRGAQPGETGQQQDEQRRPQARPNARIPVFSPKYREKVFETHKSDPEKWTIPELAKHFRLTEDHVSGILLVMKHREQYLARYKDVDDEMVDPSLEQLVVKKCGEHVPQQKQYERPVCKNHYRFLPLDGSKDGDIKHFSSMESELEFRRREYEERIKKKNLKEKHAPVNPIVDVKKVKGFEVVFQSS